MFAPYRMLSSKVAKFQFARGSLRQQTRQHDKGRERERERAKIGRITIYLNHFGGLLSANTHYEG